MAGIEDHGIGGPPAAVVLAAGGSTRFGTGRPKWRAPAEGESAVRRIVRLCAASGCRRIVVVGGPDVPMLSEELLGTSAVVVPNADWGAGRTGSIRIGFRELGAVSRVVLWPIDTPFVAATTLPTLLEHGQRPGLALWWTPTFEGRGGHPIVLDGGLRERIDALPPDLPFRSAPFRGGLMEQRVPVDDPGILDNLNTPVDYLGALARWRARGRP